MTRSPALEPPPGNLRFPLADSVRGIGVLIVILAHSTGFSNALHTASWGWVPMYAGFGFVAAFFGLSGFLLYRPFVSAHAGLRTAPSVGSYARRRALRIIPGYWFAITVLAIWPGVNAPFNSHWWAYFGFLQVYSMHTLTGGIPLVWSLCAEVTFYLLLPVLVLLAGRLVERMRPQRWWQGEIAVLIPFFLIGPVMATYIQTASVPPWVDNTLAATSDWFALGMVLAVASVAAERRGSVPHRVSAVLQRGTLLWVAAGATLLISHTFFDRYMFNQVLPRPASTRTAVVNNVLFGVAALFLLLPVVFDHGGGLVRRLLSLRAVAFVGVVSYGMYLWHLPIEAWLSNVHGEGWSSSIRGPAIQNHIGTQITLTLFVSTAVLAFIAGTFSYYVVELPFLRRKERRLLAPPAGAPRRSRSTPVRSQPRTRRDVAAHA